MERYLIEFDVFCRKAEAGVIMGGPCPEACVSILRMQNAALSRNGKSLFLASVQGPLDFPIAAEPMRRLFGSLGGPARRDGLGTTDFHMEEEEEDLAYEPRVADRKAEKARTDPPRRSRTEPGGRAERLQSTRGGAKPLLYLW